MEETREEKCGPNGLNEKSACIHQNIPIEPAAKTIEKRIEEKLQGVEINFFYITSTSRPFNNTVSWVWQLTTGHIATIFYTNITTVRTDPSCSAKGNISIWADNQLNETQVQWMSEWTGYVILWVIETGWRKGQKDQRDIQEAISTDQ